MNPESRPGGLCYFTFFFSIASCFISPRPIPAAGEDVTMTNVGTNGLYKDAPVTKEHILRAKRKSARTMKMRYDWEGQDSYLSDVGLAFVKSQDESLIRHQKFPDTDYYFSMHDGAGKVDFSVIKEIMIHKIENGVASIEITKFPDIAVDELLQLDFSEHSVATFEAKYIKKDTLKVKITNDDKHELALVGRVNRKYEAEIIRRLPRDQPITFVFGTFKDGDGDVKVPWWGLPQMTSNPAYRNFVDKSMNSGLNSSEWAGEIPVSIRQHSFLGPTSVLSFVPGYFADKSAGESNGFLIPNKLPSFEPYGYVIYLEDGMPVFDAQGLLFTSPDVLTRLDEGISRIHVDRSASSVPFGLIHESGVIDFASRTGRQAFTATLQSRPRAEISYGNKLPVLKKLDILYNFGAFLSSSSDFSDEALVKKSGFDQSQIRLNVVGHYEDLSVRIYGKYFNNENRLNLGSPEFGNLEPPILQGDKTFPDLEIGRYPTPEMSPEKAKADVLLQDGSRQAVPLRNIQTQDGGAITIAATKYWGDKTTLIYKSRYINVEHTWNGIVPLTRIDATGYAQELVDATPNGSSYEFSVPVKDDTITVVSGMLEQAGLWHIVKPMRNLSNLLQLNATIGRNTLAAGIYVGAYSVHNSWDWHDVLTLPQVTSPIAPTPVEVRLVDLAVMDSSGNAVRRVTDSGFLRYGAFYAKGRANASTESFFFSNEHNFSHGFSLKIGARLERTKLKQTVDNGKLHDLGGATDADDAIAGSSESYTTRLQTFDNVAGSIGMNYSPSDFVSLNFRGSNTYNVPTTDDLLFEQQMKLKSERLRRIAADFRVRMSGLSLSTSIFSSEISNMFGQETKLVPETRSVIFAPYVIRKAKTQGVEVLADIALTTRMRITGGITFQDNKYIDFKNDKIDFSGNRIKRIPQVFSNVALHYALPKFRAWMTWNHIGNRFSDSDNSMELPSLHDVNFGCTYQANRCMTFEASVFNIFNSEAITEANPLLIRDSVSSGIRMMRRLIPLRFVLSGTFHR